MDALMIASGGVPPPGAANTPPAGETAIAGVLRGAGQPAPFAMLMAALVPPAGQGAAAPALAEPPAVPGARLAEDEAGVTLTPGLLGGAISGAASGLPESGSTEPLTLRPDRAAEAGASGLASILAALLLTTPAASLPPEVAAGIPAAPLAGLVAHSGEAVSAALTGGGSSQTAAPPLGGEGVDGRPLDMAMPGPDWPAGGSAAGRAASLATGEGAEEMVRAVRSAAGPIGLLAGAAAPGLTATVADGQPAVLPADRAPEGGQTSIAPGVAGAEEANAGVEAAASRQVPAGETGQIEPAAAPLDGAGALTPVPLAAAAGLASTGGPGDAASGVAAERSAVDAATGSGLADGLAESVQGALRRGEREMRLVLNPPELGEVHVRVQESATGVRVALEAATREAHDLIQRHLPALREGLVSRDLPVDRLDVQRLERGADGHGLDGGGGRGASGDGQSGNRWAAATGDGFSGPGEPGWSPVARLGLGGRVTDERSSAGAGRAASSDAAAGRLDVRA